MRDVYKRTKVTASYPIPSRPRHIGGSLRTPHHNCWLQMLNLYWRPANPHINLDVVICCAGAIVGLFESAEDREVNNSALLIDHLSIAERDEALTELGHALSVNISPHVLHKIVPAIQREIVPRIQQALEIALLEVERPHRRALGKLDDSGLIFCRHSGLREERAAEDGDTNECDTNKAIHKASYLLLSCHRCTEHKWLRWEVVRLHLPVLFNIRRICCIQTAASQRSIRFSPWVDTHSFRRLRAAGSAVDFQEQGCNIIFIGRIAILPAHLILFSPF